MGIYKGVSTTVAREYAGVERHRGHVQTPLVVWVSAADSSHLRTPISDNKTTLCLTQSLGRLHHRTIFMVES